MLPLVLVESSSPLKFLQTGMPLQKSISLMKTATYVFSHLQPVPASLPLYTFQNLYFQQAFQTPLVLTRLGLNFLWKESKPKLIPNIH